MIAEGLLYTEDHEWAKIEGNIATVGITDYAQKLLGEITFVELPAVGKEVNVHDEIAVAESSKSASDVYSPVAGKVTETNKKLLETPELINDDCYGAGWLYKIEISDKSSLGKLMDARKYREFTGEK